MTGMHKQSWPHWALGDRGLGLGRPDGSGEVLVTGGGSFYLLLGVSVSQAWSWRGSLVLGDKCYCLRGRLSSCQGQLFPFRVISSRGTCLQALLWEPRAMSGDWAGTLGSGCWRRFSCSYLDVLGLEGTGYVTSTQGG